MIPAPFQMKLDIPDLKHLRRSGRLQARMIPEEQILTNELLSDFHQ